MITKFKRKIKSLAHFVWLILLIIIITLVTNINQTNKNFQYGSLKKTLNNVYFQKTFEKITSKLEDRYTELEYVVKEGDNYESIIYGIKIPQDEKNF